MIGVLAAAVLFIKGIAMASNWTAISVDASGLHNPKAGLLAACFRTGPMWYGR